MQRVTKQDKLSRLLRWAARCANIEAFQRAWERASGGWVPPLGGNAGRRTTKGRPLRARFDEAVAAEGQAVLFQAGEPGGAAADPRRVVEQAGLCLLLSHTELSVVERQHGCL